MGVLAAQPQAGDQADALIFAVAGVVILVLALVMWIMARRSKGDR